MEKRILNETKRVQFELFTSLYELFQENEDCLSAKRVKDLAIKWKKEEYSITFCGHFSAGKSSIINALMEEDLLPTSPIPTSANLVKVLKGEGNVKVYFKKGSPRLYPAPYNTELIKSYCKDGDQIDTIEISYKNTKLPDHTIIMDTPGIDSSNDAHRLATESAIHLADLVFYIMDYNHVQSEINFLFTKELMQSGKSIILVVNQIDKHRNAEISFDDFNRSVKDSFALWGINPNNIFYTSLKDKNHPQNQFQELKNFINKKIHNRKKWLPESMEQSLKKISNDHIKWLAEKEEDRVEELRLQLQDFSEEDIKNILGIYDKVKRQLEEINLMLKEKEYEVIQKIDDILKNAYLIPFETRELAQHFLYSQQKDFKVGLFFSKQKTEFERNTRFDAFYRNFSENVKVQIEWHIKELFMQLAKENNILSKKLENLIQDYHVNVSKEVLVESIKPGARVTGDYVITYTNDVAGNLRSSIRKELIQIQNFYLDLLKKITLEKEKELQEKLTSLKEKMNTWEQLNKIQLKLQNTHNSITQYLSGNINKNIEITNIDLWFSESKEDEVLIEPPNTHVNIKPINNNTTQKMHDSNRYKLNNNMEKENIGVLTKKIKYTANEVKDLPGFKQIAINLMKKAERMENKNFTVALFGAFSAGKSSFANALLDGDILPVSPNPTTATINRIKPITKKHSHGTVLVKLKTSSMLLENVNHSLKLFGMNATDLEDAFILVSTIQEMNSTVKEKIHITFLNAFQRGYPVYREDLGKVINTELDKLHEFVANEEKSCLVDLIDVYYDCMLTRKGITLVDTPGADSINSRHTSIAFEYIKNSDAVLFVTYYNHAFSKADREFIIQLGRVKDSFELDKMFFIINAIDLAKDEEELEEVKTYVTNQLVKHGIRDPHIFPVSSLLAMEEKMNKEQVTLSRLAEFERSFYSFITLDLLEITINSATKDWERAVEQIRSLIRVFEKNEQEKQFEIKHLIFQKDKIFKELKGISYEYLRNRLYQEVDELTFYIKQRVFFRLNDFIKESFNPSILIEDGRNKKSALNESLDDFLFSIGFDFAQELRATSLRIETYIRKILLEMEEDLTKRLRKINKELDFSQYESEEMGILEFESAFILVEKELFNKALSHFKNAKGFFEKNERRFLSQEIDKVLQKKADDYLEIQSNRLKDHYSSILQRECFNIGNYVGEQVEEYYKALFAAMNDDLAIEDIKGIFRRITMENFLINEQDK